MMWKTSSTLITHTLVIITITAIISNDYCIAGFVNMKIVEEPSNFGINHIGSQVRAHPLQLRLQPANFSGPPHLARLLGRCYAETIDNYKYELCPFHNVTQREQRNHWNPYNGVLGVWQEWEIENNTFVAMIMGDGDNCGERFRSSKVTFECANHSKIVSVSEPQTCNYHIVLRTPLVCHADSMLVYPTLSEELQHRWDRLEKEMLMGHWTEKGYQKRLEEIFQAGGLRLTQSSHKHLQHQAEQVKRKKFLKGSFTTLDTCREGFKELQEQVKRLEAELAELRNSTGGL